MSGIKDIVIPEGAVILNAGQAAKELGLKTYYSFNLVRYSPQFKRTVREVSPNNFLRSELIKFKEGR